MSAAIQQPTPESLPEARVLVVDDESNIVELLAVSLKFQGFEVVTATSGPAALDRAREVRPDVVLLDVMMPGMDGFGVLRRLRADGIDAPALFLTARDSVQDKVTGLTLGGDDYVTKPFSPRELVARVRARLRRAGAGPAASVASADPWVMRGAFAIDREGHRIRYRQQLLDLTRYEYAVLDALLQRPGAILSRAQLMDRGWDSDADSADRTVDTHIKTLRTKLRAAGAHHDPIRTHRGLGYALET